MKITIPSLTEQHYSSDKGACSLAGTEKKVMPTSSVSCAEDF
jgi:hypothetical protein